MLAQHTVLMSTILLTVAKAVFRFSDVLETQAWIQLTVVNIVHVARTYCV